LCGDGSASRPSVRSIRLELRHDLSFAFLGKEARPRVRARAIFLARARLFWIARIPGRSPSRSARARRIQTADESRFSRSATGDLEPGLNGGARTNTLKPRFNLWKSFEADLGISVCRDPRIGCDVGDGIFAREVIGRVQAPLEHFEEPS